MKIIYIGGYGRSGSSLIDAALGTSRNGHGSGELTWFFEYARDDLPCSCGSPVSACRFWHDVLLTYQEILPGISWAKAARITRAAEDLTGRHRDEEMYLKIWGAFFDSIGMVYPQLQYFVDSSKSCRNVFRRVILLDRLKGHEVRFLVNSRNLPAVLRSTRKGNNRELAKAKGGVVKPGSVVRGFLGWQGTYLLTFAQIRRLEDARFIRYEDFISNPAGFLGDILKEELGLEDEAMRDALSSAEGFAPSCCIAGNRMRQQARIRILPAIHDASQANWMIPFLKFLGKPTSRKLGYE